MRDRRMPLKRKDSGKRKPFPAGAKENVPTATNPVRTSGKCIRRRNRVRLAPAMYAAASDAPRTALANSVAPGSRKGGQKVVRGRGGEPGAFGGPKSRGRKSGSK
jgi:hypothetical protein